MVRQGVGRAVIFFPQRRDRLVDILQDLICSLIGPVGGTSRPDGGRQPRHGRIVHQPGGAHLAETFVHIPVDQLVTVQPDALVQEGFRVAADAHHLLALHNAERHVFGEVEGPRNRLGHVRLDHGDVVRHVKEQVIVLPAGGSIGHVDGRNRLNQASAGNDRHIPRPLRGGQGLKDDVVNLFELLHQESISIITRHPTAQTRGSVHS